MYLHDYKGLSSSFGIDAKVLSLSHLNLKGIIFLSSSYRLSPYDDKHIGRFISDGTYKDLYLYAKELLPVGKIVFLVEYGVLSVCKISMKTDGDISIVNKFTIGLFYQRDCDVLMAKLKQEISISAQPESKSNSVGVKFFFRHFSKEDINSEQKLNDAFDMYDSFSLHKLKDSEKKYIQSKVC